MCILLCFIQFVDMYTIHCCNSEFCINLISPFTEECTAFLLKAVYIMVQNRFFFFCFCFFLNNDGNFMNSA